MLEEDRFSEIRFEHILEMIKELEATFTAYLMVMHYQWASETYRSIFMKELSCTTDLHTLKESLKALQENFLFA